MGASWPNASELAPVSSAKSYLLKAADGAGLAHLNAKDAVHTPVNAEVRTAQCNVCGHLAYVERVEVLRGICFVEALLHIPILSQSPPHITECSALKVSSSTPSNEVTSREHTESRGLVDNK